jgi:hypothetical protein
MFNIYAKKETTEYNTQNVVQIIDAECKNTESKCNFCDNKIYWNPSVINRRTRKRLPLSEPYNGQGTNPVAHRGCKYNTENFFTSMVIQEKDSPYIKKVKINTQNKLIGVDESGHSLVERLILQRTPEEVQSYNEFIKKATEQSFNSGK